MLKTIEYLLDKQYNFSVANGNQIVIFEDTITFNDDNIVVRDSNHYFSFSSEEFHAYINDIISTIKDDTFSEKYATYEGTKCPICGKVYTDTTWHEYVDIYNKFEVLGSICDECIDLAILDIYKKVGGVPIEDFDSTTTNKIRNYEEIKQYLQID